MNNNNNNNNNNRFSFINFIEFSFDVFSRRIYLYLRFITLFFVARVIYIRFLRYIIICVMGVFIIIIKFGVFISLYYILKLKAAEILNNIIFFFEIFAVVFFVKFYKFIIYKIIRYRFACDFNKKKFLSL